MTRHKDLFICTSEATNQSRIIIFNRNDDNLFFKSLKKFKPADIYNCDEFVGTPLVDCPPRRLSLSHPSGWITADNIFLKAMKHFVKHVK